MTKQTALVWYAEKESQLTLDLIDNKIKPTQYAILKTKLLIEAVHMDKDQKKEMFACGRQYQLTGEGTFTQVHEELYGR
jgi:hypothetical protein